MLENVLVYMRVIVMSSTINIFNDFDMTNVVVAMMLYEEIF